MSASSTEKGLLTPANCAVMLINFQPQMILCVASVDRRALLNHALVLAKAARLFTVPVILTSLESDEFSRLITPQMQDMFPDQASIDVTSMNAWDNPDVVAAIQRSGRRNIVMAGLWTESSLVFPALQMLEDGYGIYVVEDASGGTSRVAHDAAIRRIEQAGGVSVTALQVLLEFQRDWANREHHDEVMAIVKEHCGAYGQGVEYVESRVRHASGITPRKERER